MELHFTGARTLPNVQTTTQGQKTQPYTKAWLPSCYPADSDLTVHTDPCRMAIDSVLFPQVNEKGLEESNAIQLSMHI